MVANICVVIYNRFWKCDIKGAPDGILKDKKIAIKDNCCVAGVPMRNGTSLLDGYTPDMDATVVTRILDAGKAQCCFAIQAWRRETGLSSPVKYFTDRSKAVLLLWIFYVFYVLCLLCLCAHLFICVLCLPAGKGLTSWLSFVVSNCEFVTFPLVSWVRCGT